MVESIEELRKICQGTRRRIWQRKISIYFTKLLLYTGITGNQTTMLSVLTGFLAGIFLAYGEYVSMIIGAILLELWHILDHVDGEVARYRGAESFTGGYVDHLAYYIVEPYAFVCLSFGVYNIFGDVRVFIFGFSTSLSIMLIELVHDVEYALCLRKYQVEKIKTSGQKHIDLDQDGQFNPSVRRVFQFVISFIKVPRILHVVLAASLLSAFLPHLSMFFLTFDYLYLILILYGIFAIPVWMTMVLRKVATKSTDKLYYSVFKP